MSKLRIINLEQGMPAVKTAVERMKSDLTASRKMGYAAVKLIHGYGSSGKGGKIRTGARRELQSMRSAGQLAAVIPGEKFSIFEEETRLAFRNCPDLRKDEDLDQYNNGITIVIL